MRRTLSGRCAAKQCNELASPHMASQAQEIRIVSANGDSPVTRNGRKAPIPISPLRRERWSSWRDLSETG
jgi:hypothetical protein